MQSSDTFSIAKEDSADYYDPEAWQYCRTAELYKPISLLPALSKLFEKLLLLRLFLIIEKHKLIPSHQFGFRCKHATIEQLYRIV
jgi:hypothetical protein